MALDQSNVCKKCYKSKYFRMVFHLLKYYQKIFSNLIMSTKIITRTIFDTNFLKFIILYFYIVSTTTRFSVLIYALHNDNK